MQSYSKTIPSLFAEACEKFNHLPAYTCLGQSLSFAEIEQLSRSFAAFLQYNSPLKAGDRIAIQLPNLLQYPVAAFGAFRAGLVVVNVNPLYTEREVLHQLNDSGAKAIITLQNTAHTIEKILAKSQLETIFITQVGDLHPPFKRVLINTSIKYIKKAIPAYHLPQAINFCHALKAAETKPLKDVPISTEDTALLQYTGGTSGVSKGVILTHKNIVANATQVHEHLKENFNEAAEIIVGPLPLYHIYAFQFHIINTVMAGSHSLLIPDPRDLNALVRAIKPYRFTTFLGISTLLLSLSKHDAFKALNFSSLKITSAGGMALNISVAREWTAITGKEVCEGYGMTETSPVIACNKPSDNQYGTVGKPVPYTEVKVIDEHNNTLPADTPGELCVRGPQVTQGYWQRPEETAQLFTKDGWLKTGDIAVIQSDDYIRIVDRLKDTIIVSGFNVYPNEIEEVLNIHPDILLSAVVGLPTPNSGETIKAFIVPGNTAPTKESVIKHCREHLTGYKIPKEIEFTSELPTTNVGKILRRKLKQTPPPQLAP